MSDSEKQPEGEVETTERPATSGKKVIGKIMFCWRWILCKKVNPSVEKTVLMRS